METTFSNYNEIKIFVAVNLLIITVISTFSPWIIKKQYGSKSSTVVFMSYCNCLAGGTVLGVMLMHVFPNLVMTKDFLSEGLFYPLVAMFSAGTSFLSLFAIDRLLIFQFPSHIHADSECFEDNLPVCNNLTQPPPTSNEIKSKSSALAMILALSLHSFLEGLGLGSIHARTELVSYIIGLVSHKWLEAFALGVNIFRANFTFSAAIFLNLFYAFLTPLGRQSHLYVAYF